jgi:Flp pilus assembly protein CpaB
LVTTRSFPTGTTGAEILKAGALETESIPQRYALPGAFTRPEDLVGLTLTDNISAGEQITAQRFATAEQNALLADFPEGTEALALPVEHVRGIAGHVRAGDSVNAFVTVTQSDAQGTEVSAAPVSSRKVFGTKAETFLLLRGVLVQEVQGSVAEGGSTAAAAGPRNMILAVTPQQAALLIHAQENAKLWFTLVSADGGAAE